MCQALTTTMQTMTTSSSIASPTKCSGLMLTCPANCVSHSVPTYQATTEPTATQGTAISSTPRDNNRRMSPAVAPLTLRSAISLERRPVSSLT